MSNKQIKAIYKPDLAFDHSERSFIFKYNKELNCFEMESDPDFKYNPITILEDPQWMVFEVELLEDQYEIPYGESRLLSIDEVKEYFKMEVES